MSKNIQLTDKSEKVIEVLRDKRDWEKVRMPTMRAIHGLLTELKVPHEFNELVNTFKHQTKKKYNNPNNKVGKKGFKITIWKEGKIIFNMDSSDSYYSYKTIEYSEELLKIIEPIIL